MPTSETTRATSTFPAITCPSRCLQRAWSGKVTARMLLPSSGGSGTFWPQRPPWSLSAAGSSIPPSPACGGRVTGRDLTWRPTTLFTKVNTGPWCSHLCRNKHSIVPRPLSCKRLPCFGRLLPGCFCFGGISLSMVLNHQDREGPLADIHNNHLQGSSKCWCWFWGDWTKTHLLISSNDPLIRHQSESQ